MIRSIILALFLSLCLMRCGVTQPPTESSAERPKNDGHIQKEKDHIEKTPDASIESSQTEQTPEQLNESTLERVQEPTPEHLQEPTPEPVKETHQEKNSEPASENVSEEQAEPIPEKQAEPTPETPMVEATPEKRTETIPEKRTEATPEEPTVEKKPIPLCQKNSNHGQACSAGKGVCKRMGKLICHSNGVRLECSVTEDLSKKKTEKCDGLDNDCDGKTDESTCNDGKACNGIEVCDSKAKRCLSGTPKICSDKNACNGIETCNASNGQCKPAQKPTCPVAPPDGLCKSPVGTGAKPVSGKLTAIANSKRFQLTDTNQWQANTTIIQKLTAHSSVTKVTLKSVMGDLNRSAKTLSSVKYVPCYHSGFQWNSGDSGVGYWYPQGLTGTASAYSKGTYLNKTLLMASWYHKPKVDSSTSTNKGARLSLADVTNIKSIKYRLMLLVEPYMNGTRADFRPVVLHAGGIAWYKNLLYVADTSNGLRVFDMNQILKVTSGEKNSIGYSTSKKVYHGFNYKYVVPQVSAYKLCWSCCARFSFVAADVTSNPPALVTGEYTATKYTARIHRWPLDSATGRLKTSQGVAQASHIVFPSVRRIQGALSIKGRYWISSSQPKSSSPSSPGSLYTATVGSKVTTYTFPYPPEDLHYNPQTQRLWSLTENPNKRYVFSFSPSKVQNNCK